ncbi:hypothetical protein [Ornithinimicrobium kibberense]|uniref:hypothetical protein n=1 Tax=Ornithinimicrobium kibberense TaxID=282060 RepID=UPI00360BD14B
MPDRGRIEGLDAGSGQRWAGDRCRAAQSDSIHVQAHVVQLLRDPPPQTTSSWQQLCPSRARSSSVRAAHGARGAGNAERAGPDQRALVRPRPWRSVFPDGRTVREGLT